MSWVIPITIRKRSITIHKFHGILQTFVFPSRKWTLIIKLIKYFSTCLLFPTILWNFITLCLVLCLKCKVMRDTKYEKKKQTSINNNLQLLILRRSEITIQLPCIIISLPRSLRPLLTVKRLSQRLSKSLKGLPYPYFFFGQAVSNDLLF